MKRLLILISFTVLALTSSAQKYQDALLYGENKNRADIYYLLGIPNDTFAIPSYPQDKRRHPHVAAKDNTIYLWDTTAYRWNAYMPGGSGGGLSQLGNTGTLWLTRLNDSTYKADSAAISGYLLRRKDSAATANPLGYVTLKILNDSLNKFMQIDTTGKQNRYVLFYDAPSGKLKFKIDSTAGGSSGVTSVGTGYGLSGGTITATGTILVDSATLAGYMLRRKDSLTGSNPLGYLTQYSPQFTGDKLLYGGLHINPGPTYDTSWVVMSSQSNPWMFFMNGTENKIGINNGYPATTMHIKNGDNSSAPLLIENNSSNTGVQVQVAGPMPGIAFNNADGLRVFAKPPGNNDFEIFNTAAWGAGTTFHKWFADGGYSTLGSIASGSISLTASAQLALTSTDKGFLPPRLTTTQRNAIASPAFGLMIYNTTDSAYQYYRASGWAAMGSGGSGAVTDSLKYVNDELLLYQTGASDLNVHITPSILNIDSLYNPLAGQQNDTTWRLKSLRVQAYGTTQTPTLTDSSFSVNITKAPPTKQSVTSTSDTIHLVNDSTSFVGATKIYGYSGEVRGWKDALEMTLTSPQTGEVIMYSAGALVNGRKVDTIYRTAGKDSIFFKIAGTTYKVKDSTGGGGIPGGSTTQVQYNSAGSFAGSSNMTFDGTQLYLPSTTTQSGLKVGGLEMQHFATNNNWLADNVYFNAGFKTRVTGYTPMIYFNSGAIELQTSTSTSTAGAAAGSTTRLKIIRGGNIAIGPGASSLTPTAQLHFTNGLTTAGGAPIKIYLTGSGIMSTPEAGAIEFKVDSAYYTGENGNRYQLTQSIYGSATLDFASTAAQTSTDLTIVNVTGAADGDIVSVGMPNASTNANSCFTAWVSAANTVTVRFNNYSAAAIDPASGTFKIRVLK